MKRLLLAIAILSLITTVSQARTTCSQFKDHAQAQKYFDARRHGYKSLDRDNDEEACECLRGGSSYDKSVCKKWRKRHKKK